MNAYEWADSEFNAAPTYETGFTQLLSTGPYRLPSVVTRLYQSRYGLIRSFQKIAVDIFRAALDNETPPIVLHWLMNETLEPFGLRYHRSLEDRHFALPVFFRTDEARPGRIIEINCPAALWPQLQLAFEHSARMGYCIGDASPAQRFATQLTELLTEPPVIHQFVDNAVSPGGVRYFIAKTRPAIKYWGIDRSITMHDCNFIRNQSFVGTCIEDQFRWRLARVGRGVTYEYPPHTLFDQKATLVLPFWSMTRGRFSDDISGLFPFTTPLLPTGIELPDGSTVSIEAFSRWPRSQRAYYLKYAGADWTMNFGSRAVYRLTNMSSDACLDFLEQCLSQFEGGQIWLLQQEETQDDEVSYLTRDGAVHTDRLRARFSGFYGPGGIIGLLALHGRRNKVHGQADTVFSYVLADTDSQRIIDVTESANFRTDLGN